MKKLILFIAIVFSGMLMPAQEQTKEALSKFDSFASKTGTIIKFVDYELRGLPLTYGVAETKIRKLMSGGEVGYFYQISYKGKYDTKIASIAYEDLIEINKAIQTLKSESVNDASSPNYLENKFITEDGFQLGYYAQDGKTKWFLVLERFGSGNTIFVKEASKIEEHFSFAKSKIEELKSN